MHKRNPWIYVPTLYLAEGLPYAVVTMMSGIYLKSLGASNTLIGLTSLLLWPWVLKFVWAPWVDFQGDKKNWVCLSQLSLTAVAAGLALATLGANPIYGTVIALGIMAFIGATHDIAADGIYLESLSPKQQSLFVGVRNTAYRVAMVFASGGLVYLAGTLESRVGLKMGWLWAFVALSALFLALALFHRFYLPARTAPSILGSNRPAISVLLSYFRRSRVGAIIFYMLFFRLGDALMLKQASNFLLDSAKAGGLALSVKDVGVIYGTVGIAFLLLGGILGGWLISRGGLKRWLWPTAVFQNGAILLYWLLAYLKPSIAWVYAANSVEQLAYGLGSAAYTVFLLLTVKGPNKASHYSIVTALMVLGLMIPGMASGYLQQKLGYTHFFLLSFLASIPGIIAIFFLPLADVERCPLVLGISCES